MRILIITFVLMGLSASINAIEPSPVTAVDQVDLERYSGKWYEIARLPNKFQRKCDCNTTAEYSSKPDGNIRVINRCRKTDGTYIEAEGVARKEKKDGPNSRLKVRFAPSWLSWLPAVWGNYWIIDLAPDYSYAVVGEPSRKYLWILSRTPSLADAVRDAIFARLQTMGYDIEKLIFTRHE